MPDRHHDPFQETYLPKKKPPPEPHHKKPPPEPHHKKVPPEPQHKKPPPEHHHHKRPPSPKHHHHKRHPPPEHHHHKRPPPEHHYWQPPPPEQHHWTPPPPRPQPPPQPSGCRNGDPNCGRGYMCDRCYNAAVQPMGYAGVNRNAPPAAAAPPQPQYFCQPVCRRRC